MSYTLNDKIKNLTPYEPMAGDFAVRLDANESPFNYPPVLMEQITKAVTAVDFNRYPDPCAVKLVQAFADYYEIAPDTVTAGNGSDELICLIETAFLQKGDTLLVIDPDFSMYSFYSSICEVECVHAAKDDKLQIDIEALLTTIHQKKPAAVILSNPCNPTGQGITAVQAQRLVTGAENCLIVLDEAYMDFWTESMLNKAAQYPNLIILRTASKAMGSAALRLGFAVANPTITNALRAVKSPYNVSSVSQALGQVIYTNKKILKNYQNTIVNNAKKLYNDLVDISKTISDFTVYQTCTNFVYIKTGYADALFAFLMQHSIVIRKFNSHLRITAGSEQENTILLAAVTDYFSNEV